MESVNSKKDMIHFIDRLAAQILINYSQPQSNFKDFNDIPIIGYLFKRQYYLREPNLLDYFKHRLIDYREMRLHADTNILLRSSRSPLLYKDYIIDINDIIILDDDYFKPIMQVEESSDDKVTVIRQRQQQACSTSTTNTINTTKENNDTVAVNAADTATTDDDGGDKTLATEISTECALVLNTDTLRLIDLQNPLVYLDRLRNLVYPDANMVFSNVVDVQTFFRLCILSYYYPENNYMSYISNVKTPTDDDYKWLIQNCELFLLNFDNITKNNKGNYIFINNFTDSFFMQFNNYTLDMDANTCILKDINLDYNIVYETNLDGVYNNKILFCKKFICLVNVDKEYFNLLFWLVDSINISKRTNALIITKTNVKAIEKNCNITEMTIGDSRKNGGAGFFAISINQAIPFEDVFKFKSIDFKENTIELKDDFYTKLVSLNNKTISIY